MWNQSCGSVLHRRAFNLINSKLIRSKKRLLQKNSFLVCAQYSSQTYFNFEFSKNNANNNYGENRDTHDSSFRSLASALGLFGLFAGAGGGLYYCYRNGKRDLTVAAASRAIEIEAGGHVDGLPLYTLNEVSKHLTAKDRIWVTFKQGVYDITDFIDKHPGGDKIMMAAGGSVEPFWMMYGVHMQLEIVTLLETYRIGNLSLEESVISIRDMQDPYSLDPIRHPALHAASMKPYNAEPPSSLLADSFITPMDLFYVRNHLPVPEVDPASYRLTIDGLGVAATELSLDDVKQFPKHTVTATIQCAGNRRKEMSKVKEVKGLSWDVAAIGNATFTGARLYDVLKSLGLNEDHPTAQHVQFEGLDTDPANVPYGASVPFEKVMNRKEDVILAYEMNGEPLSRDHGFPIRVIVPGTVGARNVKWLSGVSISEEESQSHWQQNDYKGFSPSVDWDTVDFTKSPAIQTLPVTSAICDPLDEETIKVKDGKILVKGYAWSGGGSKVVRVDVTADSGKTWYVADFTAQDTKRPPYHWAWTLWQVEIPVKTDDPKIELWAKAVDSSYNTQPENFENIWNLRGVLGNAYHKIKINLKF